MEASCRDLGSMDYKTCWDLQQALFDDLVARKALRRQAAEDDPEAGSDQAGTILLVEHPPVYTLGKSGHAENLLIGREALEAMGAQFFHIDRGGDITFHGPGQLVCYPILDLERLGIGLRAYIEALEEAVIRTVACYGIRAGRIAGASGVWIGDGVETGRNAGETAGIASEQTGSEPQEGTDAETDPQTEGKAGKKADGNPGDFGMGVAGGTGHGTVASGRTATQDAVASEKSGGVCGMSAGAIRPGYGTPRKICAIGVRSSRYITMHGFALNVSTDLEWFSRINPCGFTDRGATSIERETGRTVAMDEVKGLVVKFLSEILNVRIYK